MNLSRKIQRDNGELEKNLPGEQALSTSAISKDPISGTSPCFFHIDSVAQSSGTKVTPIKPRFITSNINTRTKSDNSMFKSQDTPSTICSVTRKDSDMAPTAKRRHHLPLPPEVSKHYSRLGHPEMAPSSYFSGTSIGGLILALTRIYLTQ